jgi:hypothetical protein
MLHYPLDTVETVDILHEHIERSYDHPEIVHHHFHIAICHLEVLMKVHEFNYRHEERVREWVKTHTRKEVLNVLDQAIKQTNDPLFFYAKAFQETL